MDNLRPCPDCGVIACENLGHSRTVGHDNYIDLMGLAEADPLSFAGWRNSAHRMKQTAPVGDGLVHVASDTTGHEWVTWCGRTLDMRAHTGPLTVFITLASAEACCPPGHVVCPRCAEEYLRPVTEEPSP